MNTTISRPKTAVIAVAGYGGRMLPITKSIEKCMLPVNNRPVIDYVINDCVDAGIKRIIIITSQHNSQVKAYYSKNQDLEEHLEMVGKSKELEMVRAIGKDLEIEYVVQPKGKYGTAVPLELARPYLEGDESFIYIMGDDFFDYNNGSSVKKLIDKWAESSCEHGLIGVVTPKELLSVYGVLDVDKDSRLLGVVEKPKLGEEPSNMISVAKYIFSRSILDLLPKVQPTTSGEYHITEAINLSISNKESFVVCENRDKYLDCGNLAGWLEANIHLNSK